MGRHSSSYKQKLRKGLWSPEEDEKLLTHITNYGHGCWSSVPKQAGLQRCGKSCRLRWINYLRPDLKRGTFSDDEENLIVELHKVLGNRWSQIAAQLPGRTDNEIKNLWNSSIKKKLKQSGIDPATHKLLSEIDNVESNDTDPNSTEKLLSGISNEQNLKNSNKDFFIEKFVNSHNETSIPSELMGYFPFHQLSYPATSILNSALWYDQPTNNNGYDTNHILTPSPIDLNSSSASFHSKSSSISSSFEVNGCRLWEDPFLMENQTENEIKSETQLETSSSMMSEVWAHDNNNNQQHHQQQQQVNYWNM